MPIVYGHKRIIKRTVHGGQLGSILAGLLGHGGHAILKGLPKKALKILGPFVLRLLSPLLMHGVDQLTGARDQFLADKPDIVKNIATTGSNALIETALDNVLTAATSAIKEKKAKGGSAAVPLEMRKMLNRRSELILNNLLK